MQIKPFFEQVLFATFLKTSYFPLSSAMSTVVLLLSSLTTDLIAEVNQRKAENILEAHKVVFTKIDASLEENKAIRDQLFKVSNVRAKYPQVFIKNGDEYTFVGDYDTVEQLNECDSLSKEILDANPTLQYLRKVFSSCEKC